MNELSISAVVLVLVGILITLCQIHGEIEKIRKMVDERW